MSTAILFSPPMPKDTPTAIRSAQQGLAGFDPSCKSQTTSESSKKDGDAFLTTLKQASHDQSPDKHLKKADKSQTSEIGVSSQDGENEASSNFVVTQIDQIAQYIQDLERDPMGSDLDFADFVKVLEDLGLFNAIEGSDWHNLSEAAPANGNPVTSIESIMIRLEQNHLVQTADLKAGFDRLTQWLATNLEGKAPLPVAGNSVLPKDAIAVGGMTPITAPVAAGDGVAAMAQSLGRQGSGNPMEILTSVENASTRPDSEIRHAADPAKPASDLPAFDSTNHHPSKASHGVGVATGDDSKIKETLAFWHELEPQNRTETTSRMSSTLDQQIPTENTDDSRSMKSGPSTSTNVITAKASESQNPNIIGEEPISKLIQETQLVKEEIVKLGSAINEETINKVNKMEAGNNENGQLNSSGQTPEKAAEILPSSKETQTGQSSQRNPAADQIVRQAAIHLRNGQHEARIDLRPEYLGHIRMQVISENQQVTVKILAEHGFVKDMIEGSLHQLKADLQQQGLEVDKLEVSVSRDSEDSGNLKEKQAQGRGKQTRGDHRREDHPAEAQPKDNGKPKKNRYSTATVDYFA